MKKIIIPVACLFMLACGNEQNTQLTALVNYVDSVSKAPVVIDTVYYEAVIDPSEDPEDPRNRKINTTVEVAEFYKQEYNELIKVIDVSKLSATEKETLKKVEEDFKTFMNSKPE